jgi:hypothetical protein
MAWQSQSTCSACVFVGSQIGSRTPCPVHIGRWSAYVSEADPAELSTPEPACPTADRPGPFTSREYGRLLLLRSRVRERARP